MENKNFIYNIYVTSSRKRNRIACGVVITLNNKLYMKFNEEYECKTYIWAVMRGIIKALNCIPDIYNTKVIINCSNAHIVNAFRRGWLKRWQRDDFKVKRGRTRANKNLWLVLLKIISKMSDKPTFKLCKMDSNDIYMSESKRLARLITVKKKISPQYF